MNRVEKVLSYTSIIVLAGMFIKEIIGNKKEVTPSIFPFEEGELIDYISGMPTDNQLTNYLDEIVMQKM